MKRLLLLTFTVGVVLSASSAFSQQNVSMSFNGWTQGGCSTTGDYQWDGACAGFYGGTINGVAVGNGAGGAYQGMLCDDFSHEIYSGETWTANAINVGTLLANWNFLGSDTEFYSKLGSNAFNDYLEMAILVEAAFSGTLNQLQGVSGATVGDVSEVLWCITGGMANCTQSGMSAAAWELWTYLKGLNLNGYNLSQFANLWLYVPTGNGSVGSVPQEMWGEIPVPEGGTALGYLLLAGVSCFGAMFLRRQVRT